MVAVSMEDGDSGEGIESVRLTARLKPDFPLFPDFTDAASDFSGASPLESIVEFLGLSVFPEPGILDRRERKERDESLVSDLLKEGYDCNGSEGLRSLLPVDFEDPAPASLDAWLPIVSRYQNVKEALQRRR